tara:strand:- start:1071 stop:1268 length:198 start_codon:yes stop_codon:yes gene_type:complete
VPSLEEDKFSNFFLIKYLLPTITTDISLGFIFLEAIELTSSRLIEFNISACLSTYEGSKSYVKFI